jgi:uncharacterized protein YukE
MADVSILGGDAVRGDADALAGVASFLRSVAQDLHDVRHALQRHTLADAWEGAAADAFAGLLKDTPADLTKAADSYDIASQAVGTYVAHLRQARSTALVLADRLAELMRRSGELDVAWNAAQRAVQAARWNVMHAADPTALIAAKRALDDRLRALANVDGQRYALRGQIDAIRRQAADNRRALDAAGQVAGDQLIRASHEGIRNANWIHRTGAVLANAGDFAVEAAKIAAFTFVDAYELIPALVGYLKDPSWKNLSEVLGHMSSALTVLAFVATIALAVFTGGAALALLPEIIVGLKAANVAVEATKLGVDTYRRTRLNDSSVSNFDLTMDAVGVFTAFTGARTAEKQTAGWVRAIAKSDSTKWNVWAAKCAIVADGKPASNVALRGMIGDVVLDQVEDDVKSFIKDQADDFGEFYAPIVVESAPGWLQSAATRVNHTVTVPRIDVLVPPLVPQPAR